MNNLEKNRGFGLIAAVLVVAALTAGSYATVKINEEIKTEKSQEKRMQSQSTTTATTTINVSDDSEDNASSSVILDLGATTTLQLGN